MIPHQPCLGPSPHQPCLGPRCRRLHARVTLLDTLNAGAGKDPLGKHKDDPYYQEARTKAFKR